MPEVLTLKGIEKAYKNGSERKITILQDANLKIKKGEIIGLVAPSGAGKSTLLHIAGLLEQADSGEITIAGTLVKRTDDQSLSHLRLKTIGFVYQFHHLLAEFSALENVVLPQRVAGKPANIAIQRAHALLKSVGLSERTDHRPAALSGGEQQRVAFCRALANRPMLLIADEPTGNLDPNSAEKVFETMLKLARSEGLSALIATHNLPLAKRLDRVVTLKGGKLETL